MSEKEWSNWVVDLAHIHHWAVAHFRPGLNARGHYETACQYDAAGFPDLVLVHPLRQLVLFRELKVGRGALDARQQLWRNWLTSAGADWDTWHPRDRTEVVRILTDGKAVAL
jgi:hypothetical protein